MLTFRYSDETTGFESQSLRIGNGVFYNWLVYYRQVK